MDNKVLDEAVEVACRERCPTWDGYAEFIKDAVRKEMRAALLAGVKVLLGEAVGFVARDSLDELHAGRCSAVMFGTYSDRHGRTIPLYAPSLGEGDGR